MKKSIAHTCNGMSCSSVIRSVFGNGAPAVAILLLSFIMGMSMYASAFPKETLKNLIIKNRLLSAPTEANPKKQLNDPKGILEVLDKATSAPFEVEKDTTFTKPVVFADQLIEEENVVSAMLYCASGDYEINILKQQKKSGSISAIHPGQMGWKAMDLAHKWSGIVLNSTLVKLLIPFVFNPNPAKCILNFNFVKSTGVEINNRAEPVLLVADVFQLLDVSSLTAGIYRLNADGGLISTFIKE